MVHARVRVLVIDAVDESAGDTASAVRELAPWSDPLITQLLLQRGWRMPLADMLARYDDGLDAWADSDALDPEMPGDDAIARELPREPR